MDYFEIKKRDEKVYIVDNTCCDMDGEHFEYEQANKFDAETICERLNTLQSSKTTLNDIMDIIHNIKYGDFEYSDLEDYIYKGVNLEDIHCKYNNITKTIKEMNKNED